MEVPEEVGRGSSPEVRLRPLRDGGKGECVRTAGDEAAIEVEQARKGIEEGVEQWQRSK